jgi:flagellar assembly protein FliH
MSSRVLRSADAAVVSTVAWRSVGGNAVANAAQASRPQRQDTGRPHGLDAEPGESEHAVQARLDTARQQGRAEGEAAGLARAGQRLDPVIANLSAAINELAQQRARLRADAEEDTVKLAIAIARRVLHRELSTDPEAILGLVKAAFGKLNARETHRLRVSPEDAAALEENRARLELPPRVEIARDPSLRRGSAVFETSRGELDASVDTQIAEIERGLADVMKRRAK